MIRTSLGRWWRREADDAAQRSLSRARRPSPRSTWVRLQLEVLEDRWVPSAIRTAPGFTANSLPHEDDSPSQLANVGFNLNFFNVQTNQVYVNNNGDITFGQPLIQFTPSALNGPNGGIPIIAPFFADVDTTPTNGPVVTYGTGTLCGLPAFAVNYINVGYFPSQLNKRDSFQVILVSRPDVGPGDFDIEFNYNQIQWETGGASGGINGLGGSSARVGYSNGTGNPGTFFELPGSGVHGAFLDGGPDALIDQTRLSSTPGQLHFLVRNGQVVNNPIPMMPTNNNVTADSHVFNPLRWVFDPATGDLEGNLTIVNVTPQTPIPSATDACLGISFQGIVLPASALTFPGPISVVLPAGSTGSNTVTNATGTTASGGQYFTAEISSLPLNDVLRIHVVIANPSHATPSTFYIGPDIQVYSGTLDPTKL